MAEPLADHLGLGKRGAGSRVLSKDAGVEDCFAHRGAGIRLEGTIMGGTEQNQAGRAWEKARDAMQESEDQSSASKRDRVTEAPCAGQTSLASLQRCVLLARAC
jgi:hypothetical protein